LWACTAVTLAHAVNAATVGRKVEYKNITLRSKRLQDALDGYKIAFISDVHSASEAMLREVVKELSSRHIDLLLLGGDFSYSGSLKSLPKSIYTKLFGGDVRTRGDANLNKKALTILSETKTGDGVFGIEGNHDNHVELFDTMEKCGIIPLSNSGLKIRDGFYLAGLEDMLNRKPSIAAATADASEDDFILLITHNPDVTMQQDTSKLDVVLCGHTHGGQISLFGLWAPIFTINKHITAYGQRFMSGWSKSRDGVPVYVSNGVGVNHKLPRVYAQPQVIILTLRKPA